MLEHVSRSPLHAFGLPLQATAINDTRGVWANELPSLGYVSLRGDSKDRTFVEKVTHSLGVALPTSPCTYAGTDGAKVLWISPDEWLIVSQRDRIGSLAADLKAALQGVRSQVADNSGGYTQVLLRGRNALDVLQHTTVYDFAALEPGRVVGTTFGKSSVYAHRSGEGFCLVMRRSFADYIWRYLIRAAAPYGLGIAVVETTGHAALGVA